MRVTGLDLSLTSTGVAHWTVAGGMTALVTAVVQPQSATGPGSDHVRLNCLLHEVGQHARSSDFVVLEGPSYGSPQKQHAMGGLWWAVAQGLWRRGTPYAVVTPHQRAKYITGKGTSGKVAVALAVSRRYPLAALEGDDEADALVLAVMGADYLGLPGVVPLPKAQREVLARIDWPPLPFEEDRSAEAGKAAAGE